MIWIFMRSEEPEIKSKQASKRDRTLIRNLKAETAFLNEIYYLYTSSPSSEIKVSRKFWILSLHYMHICHDIKKDRKDRRQQCTYRAAGTWCWRGTVGRKYWTYKDLHFRCHLVKVCWSKEKCSKDGINSNHQLTDGVQPSFNYCKVASRSTSWLVVSRNPKS